MTADDIPAVFSVRISTTENSMTLERLEELGITPQTIAKAITEHAKGWVCEVDNAIVGFVMGDVESGEATVLALHPDHERQGYGRQLMQPVCQWLFDAGHKQLWLLTGADPALRAYGFYQALGWLPTGEYPDGDDEKFVLRRQ